MKRTPSIIASSLLALPLAACASTAGEYPSLAIRDAERTVGTFAAPDDAAQPVGPEPAPADTAGRLASIVSDARAAHREFLAAVPEAERRVAAGAGSGIASDSWSRAQIALAQLDSARSRAAVPLGDLDLLFADATLAWQQRDAIVLAREEVIALIAKEDETLAQLRTRLGG